MIKNNRGQLRLLPESLSAQAGGEGEEKDGFNPSPLMPSPWGGCFLPLPVYSRRMCETQKRPGLTAEGGCSGALRAGRVVPARRTPRPQRHRADVRLDEPAFTEQLLCSGPGLGPFPRGCLKISVQSDVKIFIHRNVRPTVFIQRVLTEHLGARCCSIFWGLLLLSRVRLFATPWATAC